MSIQIPISRGMFTLVDDVDADSVRAFRWNAMPCQHLWYARRQRARAGGGQQAQMLHSFLTGWSLVDHINGDGLDNRRANLRQATVMQNARNRRKIFGLSAYKGVARADSISTPWRARITIAGSRLQLGNYANELDAARAYDAAARHHFGEFAALNFPAADERSALRAAS